MDARAKADQGAGPCVPTDHLPAADQVRALVAAPTSDFVRVGVPFSALVLVVSVPLVGWLLPLH